MTTSALLHPTPDLQKWKFWCGKGQSPQCSHVPWVVTVYVCWGSGTATREVTGHQEEKDSPVAIRQLLEEPLFACPLTPGFCFCPMMPLLPNSEASHQPSLILWAHGSALTIDLRYLLCLQPVYVSIFLPENGQGPSK